MSTGTLRLLLVAMAIVVAMQCMAHAFSSPLIEGLPFKDSDDALRMVQVLDLRDGAGWYDLRQHRLNPPNGVPMHWSRLPDLPLLALIATLEPTLGREQAMIFAAIAVPALLVLGFFAAFVWAAVPLVSRDGLPYAGLTVMVAAIPLAAFTGGRIDHHGWQLLLAMIGAGAVLHLAAGRRHPALPVLAGLCGALGLWIGAEALPTITLTWAALTLIWLRSGRTGALALARYGLTLAIGSTALLPLALPPGAWLTPACDAFSPVSVALAWAVALFALAMQIVEARRPRGYGAVPPAAALGQPMAAALVAAVLLGLLLVLFPTCIGGPYAAVGDAAALMIDLVIEAQPMSRALVREPAFAARLMVLPLLALGLGLAAARGSHGAARTLWLAALLLLIGAMAVQLWQLRGSLLANAWAALILSWWVAKVGARAHCTARLLPRLLRRAGPALTIALLPVLAAVLAKPFDPTPQADETGGCDLPAVAALLNRPDYRAVAPLHIATPINDGAALLLLTPHGVLAAPYHRNADGLQDLFRLFYRDEADARATARRRGIDLLLVCDGEPVASHERRNGVALFYDRLLADAPPDWLRPMRLADAPGTRLFVVEGSDP